MNQWFTRYLGALAALSFASLSFGSENVNDNSAFWSPDSGKIVFASDRTGQMHIFVMNQDGSNVRQLTFGNSKNSEPSWSPDGSKIAFCTDRDGNEEIYVMDPDGGNLQNLTNHPAPDCATPGWSPDGQRLTFVSARDGDWENNPQDDFNIYVMNADGSGQYPLVTNRGYDLSTGQSWTPDGKHIIFCSSGTEPFVSPEGEDWRTLYADFEIYKIDVDGKNQTRLTFTYGEDSYPNVSPDGSEIYFARMLSDSGTNYDIYKMSIDGKTVTQVTDDIHNEGPTAWSADGKKIVYLQYKSQQQSVFVADSDGSNAVKITNTDSH